VTGWTRGRLGTGSQATLWYLAWALLLGTISLRVFGVLTGILYGESRITLCLWVIAGAGLVVIALWPARRRARQARRGLSPPGEEAHGRSPDRLERIGTVVGTSTALVALLSILLPAVPTSAAAAACRGASLHGVRYVATTQDSGANARTGPGESFEQAYRFSGNCSIGADGYCLGEPTVNAFFKDWYDTRWLVVPHHRGVLHFLAAVLSGEPGGERFVAAGVVFPQSPASRLGMLGADRCGSDAAKPPGEVTLSTSTKDGVVTLTAKADRTFNYGFAVWLPGDDATGRQFRQIQAGPSATATWRADTTASTLARPTHAIVLAIPCLAPSVPAEDALAAVAGFDIGPGQSPAKVPAVPALDDPTADRLIRTACKSPP
jgi:hypothetical protein